MRLSEIAADERFKIKKCVLTNWFNNRHKNGMSSCTRKLGKAVYIDVEKFQLWLDTLVEAE